jgi:hypothetical protein
LRRRHEDGLSLAEVLISSAIFLGISLFVIVIARLGFRSETRGQTHTDAYRETLLAMEKIRSEIRSGIVINAVGSTLSYLYIPPPDPEGVPIDFTGHPEYRGPAFLELDGQKLMRRETKPGESTPQLSQLADLGEGGELEFKMESSRILRLRVKATRSDFVNPGKRVEYEQTLKVFMENQP